jgi:SNF2 family DNA or RNA helicase
MNTAKDTKEADKLIRNAYTLSSKGLKGRLDGHYQHEGVKWMLRREFDTDSTKGGILADDMGLGKTMQAIATMRGNPTSTLIVSIVSVVSQWKDALIDFGGYRPIIVNPSFMGILPSQSDEKEKELVVLTSYSSFQKSRGNTPSCLLSRSWGRIILDEGHVIRNNKTKVFKEINSMKAQIKWILSGTPIQNGTKDILTLAHWIGVSTSATNDIESVCSKYVLRRTQDEEGKNNARLALPPLDTHVLFLNFKSNEEKRMYDDIEAYYKDKVIGDKANNSSYNAAMEGIIRCRQVCSHPKIYIDGVAKKATKRSQKQSCESDLSSGDDESLAEYLKRKSKRPRKTKSLVKEVIDPGLNIYAPNSTIHSSKIDYLCEDISDNVVKIKDGKCLVFCSWTLEMRLIQQALKKQNISSLIFDGSLSRDAKDNVLYNFKYSIIPVLILQINCGSTGLNLQCASRVYIMSPQWNPCIELQAIGRAYRKGQTSKVTCIRLVIKDTIEERCLDIQDKKTSLIMDTMMDESMQAKLGALKDDVLSSKDITCIFSKADSVIEVVDAVDDFDVVEVAKIVEAVESTEVVDSVEDVEDVEAVKNVKGMAHVGSGCLEDNSNELERILDGLLFDDIDDVYNFV